MDNLLSPANLGLLHVSPDNGHNMPPKYKYMYM